jgi:hypothetical protein
MDRSEILPGKVEMAVGLIETWMPGSCSALDGELDARWTACPHPNAIQVDALVPDANVIGFMDDGWGLVSELSSLGSLTDRLTDITHSASLTSSIQEGRRNRIGTRNGASRSSCR